jgi:hypothetical protein
MKKERVMYSIVFAGDLNPDPSGAAVALRKAGFEVTMMPEKYRSGLAHPKDDFMEASIDGTADDKVMVAIMHGVNAIVDRYGGLCDECGPIPSNHVPFEQIFDRPKGNHNPSRANGEETKNASRSE